MGNTAHAVEWTQFAIDDLDAVIDYIAQDNPARAYDFATEIYDKTLVLERHPEMGRPGRPGLPAGVRELVVHRNYIVLYQVLASVGVVEILRVKHAAQQMP
ncbi:type II toxin-antitoxin system RelE/ParE family toxin [Xanthomonas phaseoli]|uniref:Type II toxin-antitoxin system RelE/ParE family toxin n=2 Tax=Xanthomonas TaxID=338 RepID=A0A8I2BNN5_XANMN|nr:type II toxin-antitoxin system RelE/ParE family toxin [Xanthomonas phaseoli]RWU13391.1 type II toxin-antitoxin system RelE/ParE family toxin [Xanthomonas phaseoli pv. manihotis str. CIO151]KUF37038.1 plasmid stabilization protein [Xanthomonas phaseoli pv. manihotis]MBO9722035.1 type II toxin-antitoxin system RelE/ParE family toxin [Xanthomonas phaseoli pv. manihotis]MBO9757234.1 type II toxin-antitoxin system RelE/ParE family toxin [Xanthomonas phaseoli pv. manihotis]MBO9758651.1 type II to